MSEILKTCSRCKVSQPLGEYYRRDSSKDGLRGTCKSCIKERCSRPENKAKKARLWVKWRSSQSPFYILHRSAQSSKPGNLTVEDVEAIYKGQKGVCAYTGQPLDLSLAVTGSRNPYAPSVERLDNSRPHDRDNVVLVLMCLNLARQKMDLQTYLAGVYSKPYLVVPGYVSPLLEPSVLGSTG